VRVGNSRYYNHLPFKPVWLINCDSFVNSEARRESGVTQKETTIVLVDEPIVAETEQWLSACENCAEYPAIALVYLLDALTGCEPSVTEYLMCRPARCPSCRSNVCETTLVSLGTA
jgi:hypothetical protein